MKYPKVQYELDLNAKYACRFFEKNGFDYKIKRQSYELYFYKETENGKIEKVTIEWFYRLRDLKEFLAKYETEEELLKNC